MEGLSHLKHVIQKEDWMCKLDFKDKKVVKTCQDLLWGHSTTILELTKVQVSTDSIKTSSASVDCVYKVKKMSNQSVIKL